MSAVKKNARTYTLPSPNLSLMRCASGNSLYANECLYAYDGTARKMSRSETMVVVAQGGNWYGSRRLGEGDVKRWDPLCKQHGSC